MADVTLTSIIEKADGLHLYGANYTQTTTSVFVDQAETEYVFISSSEIVIPVPPPGSTVEVEKNGVYSDAMTTEEATMSDQTQTETPAAAPLTAEDYKTEQEKGPPDPSSPPQKLGPEAELNTTDPHSPYPTGSPWAEPKEKLAMNQAPEEPAAAAKEAS